MHDGLVQEYSADAHTAHMSIAEGIKRHASALALQLGQPRFGTVQSVDTATYTAKVMLEPDGILTNWLPIKSLWIGSGWGLVCPPNAGDQVICVPHDGDPDNLVIVGSVYSQQQVPPDGNQGEFWLVHQTGSSVKLTNAGSVDVVGVNMATMTVGGSSLVMTPTGIALTSSVLTHNGVDIGYVHEHGGVTPGGSNTGPPDA